MEFSTQEYWSRLTFPSPSYLPDSGIEPCSPELQADSLPSEPPGKPLTPIQFSLVQSLSRVRLFVTPWITARQASLSITNSQSSLRLMSIESVMPSCHLILCRPLLLLLPIPPSIRVFSNESTLHMRWPKYWSFSFSISPSNEHPGLISLLPPNYHDSLEDVLSMVTYCQHVTKSQVLFLVLFYWCLVWSPICIWHLTSLLQFPFSIGFCYPDIYLFYFYFSDHSFSDFV